MDNFRENQEIAELQFLPLTNLPSLIWEKRITKDQMEFSGKFIKDKEDQYVDWFILEKSTNQKRVSLQVRFLQYNDIIGCEFKDINILIWHRIKFFKKLKRPVVNFYCLWLDERIEYEFIGINYLPHRYQNRPGFELHWYWFCYVYWLLLSMLLIVSR